MSVQFNDDLVGNLDLYDFIGLSDEQARAKLVDTFEGKTPEEIEGLLEELRVRLAEIQEELSNLQDGLEDRMDAAYNAGNIASGARDESQLEEIDNLLEELGGVDSAAQAAAEHEDLLNIETDIDHYFFTDDYVDGDTVRITPTGGNAQRGMFGEVAQDLFAFDQDAANNAEELGDYPTETPETGQTIWVRLNAGDKIVDIKEEGTTKYFFIITKDGRRIELVVENVVPGKVAVTFEGSNYANPTLFNNLSDDFLKSLYENANRLSFYHIIHGEDPMAIPPTEIPEDIFNNLEGTINTANVWISEAIALNPDSTYTEAQARLTTQDIETVRQMVDMLYNSAAYQANSETTLQAAWEEIAQLLAGFSIEKQSTLMGALILHVFKNDYQNFSAFFAGYTEFAKSVVKWWAISGDENIQGNPFDELILEILEPGSHASQDYTTADAAASLLAMQWYRELIQGVDPLQVSAVDAQIQEIRNAREEVEDTPSINFGDQIDEAILFLDIYGIPLAREMREAWFGTMTNTAMLSLKTLFTSLKSASSADEFFSIITGFFNPIVANDYSDDLASIFVLLIERYAPDLANALFTNESINTYLQNAIRNDYAGAFGDTYSVFTLANNTFEDELGITGSWNILDAYARDGYNSSMFSQGTGGG